MYEMKIKIVLMASMTIVAKELSSSIFHVMLPHLHHEQASEREEKKPKLNFIFISIHHENELSINSSFSP
jgi:hypothetical protein